MQNFRLVQIFRNDMVGMVDISINYIYQYLQPSTPADHTPAIPFQSFPQATNPPPVYEGVKHRRSKRSSHSAKAEISFANSFLEFRLKTPTVHYQSATFWVRIVASVQHESFAQNNLQAFYAAYSEWSNSPSSQCANLPESFHNSACGRR